MVARNMNKTKSLLKQKIMLDYYTIFKKNDNETNTNNKSSFLKLYIYIYNLEKFFLAKIDIEKRKNS